MPLVKWVSVYLALWGFRCAVVAPQRAFRCLGISQYGWVRDGSKFPTDKSTGSSLVREW